jgi:uncharacterized membrane protein
MGFIALVIGVMLVVYFLRRNGPEHVMRNEWQQPDSGSARSILDNRYANGEISDEEYKTRKANLG